MLLRLFSMKMNVGVVLLALCAGAVFTTIVELWWQGEQPRPTDISSVSVHRTEGGIRFLRVANRAPSKESCLRITEHLLYRDDEMLAAGGLAPRVYVPLSNTIVGLGFRGVTDYTVELAIPDGTAPVEWQFVTRSIYMCNLFPGLTSILRFATKPYPVDLSYAQHE